MARKKFSKEEKKQMRKEQRQKDALRSYRCRGFKNFLFWLTGVLSSVVLIISALFVGVAVVPVRVYLGDNADGIVSYDVSSKSLINAFLKANTYDMSDFPVVADALDDLIKGAELDKYVEIDVEKIKTLKFDETFTTELQSCIKVVATMDSVGGMDAIGDVGNLEILNEWEEVQPENLPNTDGDGNIVKDEGSGELKSNPKLYYYYHVETEGVSLMATRFEESNGEWRRAFDDNGKRVPESVDQPLYYANLSQVPLLDIVDLIDETIGRLKLTDLLEGLGGAELGDTSLIGNILGDKTISQIGDITAENISLTAILPYEKSKDIYKILLQVCGSEINDWNDAEEVKAAAECLNITSFDGGLHFENVALATFLPYKDTENNVDNSDLYKMLLKITKADVKDWNDEDELKAEAEKLNINSFGGLTLENLSLTTFLPYEENVDVYEMLLKITKADVKDWNDEEEIKSAAEKLNINSFGDLSLENVSLTTFLPYEENVDVYEMLLKITGSQITDWNDAEKVKAEAEKLNINSFGNLSLENVSLTTFLPYEENVDVYEMLLKITGSQITDWNDAEKVKAEAEKLNINSFGNLSLENLAIETFIEDADTLKVLLDAVNSGIKEYNKNLKPGETPKELVEDISDLTVGHLEMISLDNMSLTSLLTYEGNEELYKILLQACKADVKDWDDTEEIKQVAESLDISSFGNLDFNNVSIEMFIGEDSTLNLLLDAVNGGIKEYNKNLNPGEAPKEEVANASKLTVGHLASLSIVHVKLDTVLPVDAKDEHNNLVNQTLYSILSDMLSKDAKSITVSDLSNIKFEKITLNTVLPVDAEDENGNLINKALYDVLVDALDGAKTAESIMISDLSSFKFDKIKLSTIMPKTSENLALYSVLLDVINGDKLMTDADYVAENKITLNHLSAFKFDAVKLNTFLPFDATDKDGNKINENLYSILVDALGGTKTAQNIMVSDLSNIKFDSIRLSTVMPKTAENSALYSVLLDVINGDKLMTDADYVAENQITLNHLSAFKFDNLKLNTVLPVNAVDKDGNKVNEGLYKILLDVVNAGKSELNKKTAEEITIADLSNFEMNNINLSTVLPYEDSDGKPTNTALYSILLDVVNGDSGTKTAKDLKLSDLTGFSYENLHLITILDPVKNASLYNVLCDVVKVDKEELKLSHLGSFSVSKIHLKTVLGDKATGNVILDKLIAKDIEISNLANAINGLSLYEIYGQNCFVEVSSGETEVARYKKQGNSYILDDNGEYKINKTAGIWLFLCFDFADEEIDKVNLSTMGCRVKYTIGDATFNSLTEQGSGNKLSKQLTTATIRQLVDAGVLESANPMLYTFTLQDAVKVKQ